MAGKPRAIEAGGHRGQLPAGLALSLIALIAAAAPAATVAPPWRDAYLEVRTTNEAARDVIDLLLPLFATLNFAEQVSKTDAQTGVSTTSFLGTNGDFIGVVGCDSRVIVAFQASRNPVGPVKLGVRDRSADFSERVRAFLNGLPTPRPLATDVSPGGTPQCWRNGWLAPSRTAAARR